MTEITFELSTEQRNAIFERNTIYQGMWDAVIGEPTPAQIKAATDCAGDVIELLNHIDEQEPKLAAALVEVDRLNAVIAALTTDVGNVDDCECGWSTLAMHTGEPEEINPACRHHGAAAAAVRAARGIDEPAAATWRDYTIEAVNDTTTLITCRSTSGCEEQHLGAADRYLTLGEAVDWAKAHVAEHAQWELDDTETAVAVTA